VDLEKADAISFTAAMRAISDNELLLELAVRNSDVLVRQMRRLQPPTFEFHGKDEVHNCRFVSATQDFAVQVSVDGSFPTAVATDFSLDAASPILSTVTIDSALVLPSSAGCLVATGLLGVGADGTDVLLVGVWPLQSRVLVPASSMVTLTPLMKAMCSTDSSSVLLAVLLAAACSSAVDLQVFLVFPQNQVFDS
jgi:hypothetical protein